LTGKVEINQTTGTFLGQKITVPPMLLSELSKPSSVLGAQTGNHQKKIFVDLTSQHLFAAEDGRIIYDFPVSTGKWHPTPTGVFHIWVKLQATRMSGGEGADSYDLPNVPWTMFFAGDNASASQGFSIHGAYWHNNLGHPMSHGCVNMRIVDAKTLFDWADPPTTGYTTSATSQNPGTEVDIYGEAPLE